jgi:AraC-like DNA-binding protein
VAVLAVFQPDPLSLARITTALSEPHEVVSFAHWAELREALERFPADGCLLDPYHASHPVGLADIRQLRERHPSLAIVVYADFSGHEMDLFTLGRFQIDGVVPAGRNESVWEIRETVAEALVSSVAQRVLSSLERRLSRFPLDCLRWAIENSHRTPGVAQIADAFAQSPGSLARRLRREGAPTAGRLLLWGRLVRATQMLGERGSTVERAAFAVGYSSGAALARALRRETGHPPGEVLRRGGVGCVLDGFVNREIRTLTPRTAGRWRAARERAFPRSRRGETP